ncbi:RNA binding protein, putative isoform 4 [Theobroma cacao]|uniref:RNA binding protein, putative isoform 4 n=1 Tax=Theobroma cacao TaxID=3641 RepID=A0A061GNG9_THECC|nr:RNA binding protein, putative isoform 4 [Theobroma cacao]
MRFKKGTKVEVLSKKEVPSGSWQCAEIISGNGHSYTVRYQGYSGATDKMIVERVSRKAIRPCPPALVVPDNWVPGDVVEVFDNFSWKMATVLGILEKKYILVRLLGSSLEFKVSRFDIRVRQSWQDDEWVVIGKGSGSCEDGKYGENYTLRYNQNSSSQFQNTTRMTNRHLKEAFAGARQKFRAVEKDGRLYRLVAANPSIHEQDDAVAFPRDMLGEKYIHASIDNRTGLSEVDAERRKPNGAVGCYIAEHLETNDTERVTCSVGSCSVSSNNLYKLPLRVSAGPIEDVDGQCSDAESFCPRGDEVGNCLLPTKEELAAEIHRIELHAYRCTMEALHASGPLSWEQEALVTNLRLSLHISNDEHLMELRNLISADSGIPIR